MLTALAVLGGFGLDLLLADPAWMPHPVVGMGRAIAALEKLLRRLFPATPAGERAAGRALAFLLPAGTFALAAGCCALAYALHPAAGFALELVWSWQALALRGLADESGRVYRADMEDLRARLDELIGLAKQILAKHRPSLFPSIIPQSENFCTFSAHKNRKRAEDGKGLF